MCIFVKTWVILHVTYSLWWTEHCLSQPSFWDLRTFHSEEIQAPTGLALSISQHPQGDTFSHCSLGCKGHCYRDDWSMCLCSIVRQDVWCTDTCAYNVSRFLVPIAHHMLLSCMHDKSIVRKWWSLALYTSLDFTYMWLHHSNVVITWLVPVCNVQLELEIVK